MINLETELPKLDREIATFEAEVTKLREAEQNQTSLQAELAQSKQRESEILRDQSSPAEEVSERLHRQAAHSRVLQSRIENTETLWEQTYNAGTIATRTLGIVAETFFYTPPLPSTPQDQKRHDHRWTGFYPALIDARTWQNPNLRPETIRQRIREAIPQFESLRRRFQALAEDIKIYLYLRGRLLAEADASKSVAETADQQPRAARARKEEAIAK